MSIQDTNFKNLPKQVIWFITFKCNYDCNYCINKKVGHDLSLEVKNANLFLRNIKKKLDKSWEFVLSGGEPFLHKDFFKIVKGLVKLGHQVTVATNFSVDPKKIIQFLKLTGDIRASLHLEYTNPDNFLKKILIIEKSFPALRDHLFITSVATNKTLPRLEKIKKKFFEKGYQFYAQLCRYPHQTFSPYSDKQKKIIERISKKYNLKPFQQQAEFYGTYGTDSPETSFKGQKCCAGCLTFYMSPNGDAFRCSPSFYIGKDRRGETGYLRNIYLGNILRKDFRLLEGATECQYEVCRCPNYHLKKLRILDR